MRLILWKGNFPILRFLKTDYFMAFHYPDHRHWMFPNIGELGYLSDRKSDSPSEEVAPRTDNHPVDIVRVAAAGDNEIGIVPRRERTTRLAGGVLFYRIRCKLTF